VLQSVPALRALRRGGPLAFAAQPRLGGLLAGAGLVDVVLSFDGLGLDALFTEEPAPPALVARLAGSRRVISWFGSTDEVYRRRLRAIAPGCVVAPPVPAAAGLPVWRHLLATVDGEAGGTTSPLAVPASWREEAQRSLAGLGAAPPRPLLVVHPGAGSRWKVWPGENLARVIERVIDETDGQALVHQGPADREATERLQRALGRPSLRLVEPGLPLLAGVLERADAYLGPDSGVSHLAAAVGAPAAIVFPAETRERWPPWSATAHPVTMSGEVDLAPLLTGWLVERMRARP
jgi:ADP-heptose:LPS heptosyltransferase